MRTQDLRHNWERTDEGKWTCECLLTLGHPQDGFCPNKIARLQEALEPVLHWMREYPNVGEEKADETILAGGTPHDWEVTLGDLRRIKRALRGETIEDMAPLGIRKACEAHGIERPWTWAAPVPGRLMAKVWEGKYRNRPPDLLVCRCGASGPPNVPLTHIEGCSVGRGHLIETRGQPWVT